MNFTNLNESNIQNEINGILHNISNLDFKSRIRKFVNVLNFIHKNKQKIYSNDIKINTKIKDKDSDIFFEILTNENIQNSIFDHGFDDDLENAETYDDLKEIYSYSLKIIKISDRVEKIQLNSNSNYSYGIHCGAFENAISLGTNTPACASVMSRCNVYGGLKSADYPFNPF